MRTRPAALFVAALFAAFTPFIRSAAHADTFGSGTNTFTIDFVTIGNAGNAPDTTGYGSVPYAYRIGKYEISHNDATKANASGLSNFTARAWTGDQPAGRISWYEVAAFVNWLNTSSGYQAAYHLNFVDGAWIMQLWDSTNAWTAGGTNRYRHKNARYFLPSENEWYKAAYYNPAGDNYFLYPTGSNTAPTAVPKGTNPGTAVYAGVTSAPANVIEAGGLSPYGTMGQGGNLWEFNETAWDGANDSASEFRVFRGGYYDFSGFSVDSSVRVNTEPDHLNDAFGFRVASVAPTSVVLTVEKTTSLSGQWQFDREINVGPMTNTNEFYRLKIRTVVE
jgi:hypothetical protein